MDRSSSFENSWADQWDYGGDPEPTSWGGGGGGGVGKKGGVEKTKAMATTGLKKMKNGTVTGFTWIKDKYQQKTKQKH
ncbi:hypothetical protein AXF42_Ash019888 [Apostasia shenzhenica]|uniref:Uncharacterized protein n=1 Tax=Apostasia shenzhenica TaxID=1088818 RepID=A0A2H9ZX73_9ASPA|nr:hypothetical protein AXF42_Ash019888 [Apostasia shenzhenica]